MAPKYHLYGQWPSLCIVGVLAIPAVVMLWTHHCLTTLPPQSNGFIERQVKTLKTTISTSQDARRTLDDLLLEMWSTSIAPKMPAPREVPHNRMIQCPSKPLMPVDMETVWNYLITKKQYQKMYFDRAYNVQPLSTLNPRQEVLFLSPTDHHACNLGTILNKAWFPEAIPLRHRASNTTGPGSTSTLFSRTFSGQILVLSHKRTLNLPKYLSPIEHFFSPPNKFPKHTATPLMLASLYPGTKASSGQSSTITYYPSAMVNDLLHHLASTNDHKAPRLTGASLVLQR